MAPSRCRAPRGDIPLAPIRFARFALLRGFCNSVCLLELLCMVYWSRLQFLDCNTAHSARPERSLIVQLVGPLARFDLRPHFPAPLILPHLHVFIALFYKLGHVCEQFTPNLPSEDLPGWCRVLCLCPLSPETGSCRTAGPRCQGNTCGPGLDDSSSKREERRLRIGDSLMIFGAVTRLQAKRCSSFDAS